MKPRVLTLLLALVSLAPANAQQRVSAPRSDGHTTPLMVYRPTAASTSCAPLALISHGAGGTENGYRYLAEIMTSLGYTAIVMGHQESSPAELRADLRAHGFLRPGVEALLADPVAEHARLLDVTAALHWANAQCPAPGKIPVRVLLGHSMGAETVMLEAGATNILNIPAPPTAQDRFDAYIALSPEGPGVVFSSHAWRGIRKPLLILTGTRDQAVNGGPQTRLIPFRELPPTGSHCHWQGVIDNATHMNFAGTGFGAEPVKADVAATIAAFLPGARSGACTLPTPTAGLQLQAK